MNKMIYRKSIRILALTLGLLVVVGLAGCATGGGSSSRSRGSLSGAMAESEGKDEEEATGRGEGRTRTKNEVYTSNDNEDNYYYEEESGGGGSFLVGLITSLFTGSGDDEEPPELSSAYLTDYSETGNRTWADNGEFGSNDDEDDDDSQDIKGSNLNFWYSRSHLAGDAIQSFSNYTLMYSWYTQPRYRAHAGFYYGRGKVGSQANVKDGLRWISEAGVDVGSRGYFTPEHSLLGVYALVGIRVGAMYWSYNTALESVADDGTPEQISKDGLMIFVPYAGIGTSLLQTKSVHLGVNFTVGGRLTVDKTFKNYENDVFPHVGEYKLNIEASIFF